MRIATLAAARLYVEKRTAQVKPPLEQLEVAYTGGNLKRGRNSSYSRQLRKNDSRDVEVDHDARDVHKRRHKGAGRDAGIDAGALEDDGQHGAHQGAPQAYARDRDCDHHGKPPAA